MPCRCCCCPLNSSNLQNVREQHYVENGKGKWKVPGCRSYKQSQAGWSSLSKHQISKFPKDRQQDITRSRSPTWQTRHNTTRDIRHLGIVTSLVCPNFTGETSLYPVSCKAHRILLIYCYICHMIPSRRLLEVEPHKSDRQNNQFRVNTWALTCYSTALHQMTLNHHQLLLLIDFYLHLSFIYLFLYVLKLFMSLEHVSTAKLRVQSAASWSRLGSFLI